MFRPLHLLAACAALSVPAAAQHIILMTPSLDERTIGNDLPEIDLIRTDEIYQVRPLPGVAYTARPFLPISLQYAYVGDLDGDGQYVEDSIDGPGGPLDVIFVKAGAAAPMTPRDVYWSITSTTGINIPGLLLSDVVRYSAQGVRDTFVTEAMIMTATGGTTLNLDALCQSSAGDLFLSFSLLETLHFGPADDGDLLMIPAAAISYDRNGNVMAIAANSVVRLATEAHLIAMVNNSGFRTSVGGTITTTFELSGLEMDPNGGTFVSPEGALTVPNLLFCWSDFSNDGAIISTANGGSIAVINGVAMGSTVATQGNQIGWLPDSTGTDGPGGLALIPIQPEAFAAENYPRNLHTQGSGQTLLQVQISGGTPGGASVIALGLGPNTPGGAFPVFPAPPPMLGELFLGSPITLGIFFNDSLGNCASQLLILPTASLAGLNVMAQALDLTMFRLCTPAAMSFL